MKNRLSVEQTNTLKLMAMIAMVGAFLIFHIWFRTWVVTKGYEVGDHRTKMAHLESELMQAKVERNRVLGPDNLERWVRHLEQGGTVFRAPQPQQLVYINQ